jgi:dolichol kinase
LKRSHSPIARALIHSSLGTIVVLAVFILGKEPVAGILAVAAAGLLITEWVRFRWTGINRGIMSQLVLFTREEEATQLSGAIYYLTGVAVTIAFFPVETAITAVLFLALGDPAATLVGKWRGKIKFWGKSLEGNLACLVICLVIAVISSQLQEDLVMATTISGALFAFLFEALPARLNDNITIPVGSALVMWVLPALVRIVS